MQIHAPGHGQIHVSGHMQIHAPGHVQIHAPRHVQIHAPGHLQIHAPRHVKIHAPGHVQLHVPGHVHMMHYCSNFHTFTCIDRQTEIKLSQFFLTKRPSKEMLPGLSRGRWGPLHKVFFKHFCVSESLMIGLIID